MFDGLPDDLADALGMVIAEQQERWEREHAAFMGEMRAQAAEHRAIIAEQKAQLVELLEAKLKSEADAQRTRVEAALAGVKNGDPGLQGEPGAPGQDAPPPTIEQVREAIAGMDLKEAVQDAVRIEYAANPPLNGKDGAPGEPGLSGKDAEPITRDQIVEAVLVCGDAINDAAARYLRANPPLNGKDGAPGSPGVPGEPGRDGRDGLPGVPGTPGRDGVDGKDGLNGKDGAPGERGLPGLHYCGVWKEGDYCDGAIVTWGGSAWIALRDTSDKPEASDAWQLFVKRGRDGKDGIVKAEEPPKPVALR